MDACFLSMKLKWLVIKNLKRSSTQLNSSGISMQPNFYRFLNSWMDVAGMKIKFIVIVIPWLYAFYTHSIQHTNVAQYLFTIKTEYKSLHWLPVFNFWFGRGAQGMTWEEKTERSWKGKEKREERSLCMYNSNIMDSESLKENWEKQISLFFLSLSLSLILELYYWLCMIRYAQSVL